ncbi:MarR family winged helix-turn-helix transcriptional regulator [Allorhizobium terrae]|uniref:MarR family transcriptional regulator n=1 Tax=Allorhizobium terrae TaxID=1848972 RepID=A0A4S3ZRT0_9HYPH|nr:MarR family transcriptional regulator [Allorhizobium terrae]THF48331.1 MarR family transcriptional regulator [Allorhizobium terrae]TWD51156.1 MarR family transcriptional regulator [Agrobacterium vitis]
MEQKSDFQRSLTSQLFTAARLWRKVVDQALIEHGISEACAAPLLWISRLGGGVRQTALAEHVGIESPSLVRLLDQLEALEMVVRKDDPSDRRAKGLWLTETGVEMAARIEAVLDRERARVLGNMSERELETAYRVLDVFQGRCFDALQSGSKKEDGQ